MNRRMYGEYGDRPTIPTTLHYPGLIAQWKSHFTDAYKLYKESLEVSRRVHGENADDLSLLGLVTEGQGDYDDAVKWYHQSLDMMIKIYGVDADLQSIAVNLCQLGSVALKKGDFDLAIKCGQKDLWRGSSAFQHSINVTTAGKGVAKKW